MSVINVCHPMKLYLHSKCYCRERKLILSLGELMSVLSVNSKICEGGCVALKLWHCASLKIGMCNFFRNLLQASTVLLQ